MCDTIVSVDAGGVWFAKNSDRDPNESQVLDWRPAADHPEGAGLRCTWKEIPQVGHTRAVLLSRPYWTWGAEMGTNDAGLVVGNEAVFTRGRVARTGLTGLDLLRLALERAGTVDEAVGVILDAIAAHGQGGHAGHEAEFRYHNSFLIASAGGAVVLETSADSHALEAVSGTRGISNGLTIQGFAASHAKWLHERVAQSADRRGRTECRAREATTALDWFGVLRDHGDRGREPAYHLLNGAMGGPCMHAGGLVAASQTTASWVSRLTPDGASHWATATAAPCTGLFKPVALDAPIALGDPADQWDDSLWWRHERVHRALMADPELGRAWLAERDRLEAAWVDDPPASAEAFAAGDRLLASWSGQAEGDVRPWWVRRYWRERDAQAHTHSLRPRWS